MTAQELTVLIVEDDQSLRESLAMVLGHQGYHVVEAPTGEEGLALSESTNPHVVVLDINLPGIDGLEVCARLRRRHFPGSVLMLTARHEVDDKVKGLDAGADDYLAKPFALHELLARVRAMMRRVEGLDVASDEQDVQRIGDLVIHRASRRVDRDGVELSLTKIEFDLLDLLASNIDIVLTRDVIHERVWGYDAEYGSNSLQVFISTLRSKLETSETDRLIQTVRGVGYMIREPR